MVSRATADTAVGVSWSDASRFSAVTTISSIPAAHVAAGTAHASSNAALTARPGSRLPDG